GSEGTIGIITQIVVKLIPLPPFSATIMLDCKNSKAAMDTFFHLVKAGISPTALEFLGSDLINFERISGHQSAKKTTTTKQKNVILLIQEDAIEKTSLNHQIERIRKIAA